MNTARESSNATPNRMIRRTSETSVLPPFGVNAVPSARFQLRPSERRRGLISLSPRQRCHAITSGGPLTKLRVLECPPSARIGAPRAAVERQQRHGEWAEPAWSPAARLHPCRRKTAVTPDPRQRERRISNQMWNGEGRASDGANR